VHRAFAVMPPPSVCYEHNIGYSIQSHQRFSASFSRRRPVAVGIVSHRCCSLPTPVFCHLALIPPIRATLLIQDTQRILGLIRMQDLFILHDIQTGDRGCVIIS
jgi:hypothetical protein